MIFPYIYITGQSIWSLHFSFFSNYYLNMCQPIDSSCSERRNGRIGGRFANKGKGKKNVGHEVTVVLSLYALVLYSVMTLDYRTAEKQVIKTIVRINLFAALSRLLPGGCCLEPLIAGAAWDCGSAAHFPALECLLH